MAENERPDRRALFHREFAHRRRLQVKASNILVAAVSDQFAIDLLRAANRGRARLPGSFCAMRASMKIDAGFHTMHTLLKR